MVGGSLDRFPSSKKKKKKSVDLLFSPPGQACIKFADRFTHCTDWAHWLVKTKRCMLKLFALLLFFFFLAGSSKGWPPFIKSCVVS